jgi:hypothetical protein
MALLGDQAGRRGSPGQQLVEPIVDQAVALAAGELEQCRVAVEQTARSISERNGIGSQLEQVAQAALIGL